VDLVRRLQPRLPAAQWLLVMQEDNAPTAREAHAIGIGGIMLKRSGFAELQRAILTLRAVRRFRGAGIGALLAASGSTADATAACGMTKREREVLHWVAEGKRNHEIATILGNRPGTVCKQMESILRKLGVETRGAAVATWRATCTTRGCSLCR
jgi:DNA-binding NarL/FixJ family response regulator